MKNGFYIVLLSCFSWLNAQQYYWLTFANKAQSEYKLQKPEEFLSENALNRRAYFNIAVSETDLPIPTSYKQQIVNLDATVVKQSKWLNGIFVSSNNINFENQAQQLPFVKSVRKIENVHTKNLFSKIEVDAKAITNQIIEGNYGYAWENISTINGQYLHQNGFWGNTIDIAVMDNGFQNVDSNTYFDSLRIMGKLHSGYNFVDNTPNVYSNGEHGAYVMSTMAAYKKDTLIGTAPLGNYYLFTTEDENAEGLPEELNWAMAAEWADSALGTWVILTTSLGYTNGFDDAGTNHTYADMDGNTTIITQAADLAAQKGMLVINSAGNEGTSAWKYIGAPADGDSVLAIGAITTELKMAEFSSYGPSFDGRTKPNICALGQGVVAVNPYQELRSVSGTSFSCPITSGMAACLWEAFPQKNNMEIMEAIQQSAHLYYTPQNHFGFGIPNFEIAYKLLKTKNDKENNLFVYPNPAQNYLNIFFADNKTETYTLKIADLKGDIVFAQKDKTVTYVVQLDITSLQEGVYYVSAQQGKKVYKAKFIKE